MDTSFPAWSGPVCVAGSNVQGVGSTIVLRPGIDFQLPAGAAPGMAGSFNISAQIQCSGCGIDLSANLAIISLTCFYSGQLELNEVSGNTSASLLGLSEAQVLDAMKGDFVGSASARGISATRATGGFLGPLLSLGRAAIGMAAPHLVKGIVEGGLKKVFGAGVAGAGVVGAGKTGGAMQRMSLSDRLQ